MSDRVYYMICEETRPKTPYEENEMIKAVMFELGCVIIEMSAKSEASYFCFRDGLKLRIADHDECRTRTVTLQHFGKEVVGVDFACLTIPKAPLRSELREVIMRGLAEAKRIKDG